MGMLNRRCLALDAAENYTGGRNTMREMRKFVGFDLEDREIFPGYDNEPDGENPPPALTQALVEEMVKNTVNNTVNNALANLRKKDLPDMFKAQLDPINTTLNTLTETLRGVGNLPKGGNGGEPPNGGNSLSPEFNAKLKNLDDIVKNQGTEIKNLTEERNKAIEKAEKTDRASNIRAALTGIEFATPSAAETAFLLVEPQVQKTDDGAYIAGDLPLSDYVKNYFSTSHAYLLKSVGAGGSGAPNGSGAPRGGTGKVADMDMIKLGMTAQERELAYKAIANAFPGRSS